MLIKYQNLHVRVSIKSCNPKEFQRLTGARPSAYKLPFKALHNLIDAGVSCNACVSVSFSDAQRIKSVEGKLESIHFGIIKSRELEKLKLFQKVRNRLESEGLVANHGVSFSL